MTSMLRSLNRQRFLALSAKAQKPSLEAETDEEKKNKQDDATEAKKVPVVEVSDADKKTDDATNTAGEDAAAAAATDQASDDTPPPAGDAAPTEDVGGGEPSTPEVPAAEPAEDKPAVAVPAGDVAPAADTDVTATVVVPEAVDTPAPVTNDETTGTVGMGEMTTPVVEAKRLPAEDLIRRAQMRAAGQDPDAPAESTTPPAESVGIAQDGTPEEMIAAPTGDAATDPAAGGTTAVTAAEPPAMGTDVSQGDTTLASEKPQVNGGPTTIAPEAVEPPTGNVEMTPSEATVAVDVPKEESSSAPAADNAATAEPAATPSVDATGSTDGLPPDAAASADDTATQTAPAEVSPGVDPTQGDSGAAPTGAGDFDEDDIDEGADDIANGLIEAGEDEDNIEDLNGEIDQAEKAKNVLAKIEVVVTQSMEKGGLSDDGAAMMQIATEQLFDTLGMLVPVGIPSLESFTNKPARIAGSQIALESMRETAAKIGAKIVEGLKKVWEWIKAFFQKVFTQAGQLKVRAEKIAKAAEAIKSTQPQARTVGTPSLAAEVSINGRVVPPSKSIAQMTGFVKNLTSDNVVAAVSAPETAIKVVFRTLVKAGGGSDSDVYNAAFTKWSQSAQAAVHQMGTAGMKAMPGREESYGLDSYEGATFYMSPVFLGNKAIYSFVPDNMDPSERENRILNFRTGGIRIPEAPVPQDAPPTLSVNEVKATCQSVVEFIAAAEAVKKLMAELDAVYKSSVNFLMEGANNGLNTYEKSKGDLVLKGVHAAYVAQASRSMMKGLHQPAISVGMGVCAHALEYAALSVKAYTAPAQAPAAQAAAKA